ncbi:hypothetical protein V5799_005936 [Amblyomma americanum]|uniref:Uncharacterized protein n=1 Tax=Amblyomma americanum TaxID=6943 RepID=A0AAQ4DXT7_AMBAM
MDRWSGATIAYWMKKPRATSAPLIPRDPPLTFEQSGWNPESSQINLPDLASNLVTFTLLPTDLDDPARQRRGVEEPSPPSCSRLVLVTCLLIGVLSAVTVTLNWLDWPFLPEDAGRSPLEHQSASVPTPGWRRAADRDQEEVRAASAVFTRDNDTWTPSSNETLQTHISNVAS